MNWPFKGHNIHLCLVVQMGYVQCETNLFWIHLRTDMQHLSKLQAVATQAGIPGHEIRSERKSDMKVGCECTTVSSSSPPPSRPTFSFIDQVWLLRLIWCSNGPVYFYPPIGSGSLADVAYKPGWSHQARLGWVIGQQIWKSVFALLRRSSSSILLARKRTFARCIDLSAVRNPC